MKNIKVVLLTVVLGLLMLTGCGNNSDNSDNSDSGDGADRFWAQEDTLTKFAPTFELIKFSNHNYVYTYYAYDKDTNVEYIVTYVPKIGYNSEMLTITMLVDSDGKPKLHDKED